MKNIKVYKIRINSTKENLFILDIYMDDKIKSHRYYFIKEDGVIYKVNRVKSIVQLLEFLEQNGIRISEVSIRVKNNLISKLDTSIPEYVKTVDNNNIYKKNYFSDLISYDLKILKKIQNPNNKEK